MTTDWAKELREALYCGAEEVPEGWFTVGQIAKMIGCGRTKAERLVGAALTSGRIERGKKFVVASGSTGKKFPVLHYQIKKLTSPNAGCKTPAKRK